MLAATQLEREPKPMGQARRQQQEEEEEEAAAAAETSARQRGAKVKPSYKHVPHSQK